MARRLITALVLSTSFAAPLVGAAILAPGAALAQSAGAKATVDAAKAAGQIGEQADGYLGLVSGSAPGDLKAAMDEINAGRARAYADIASKTGVSPSAAGEATARQLFARMPPGQWYKPLDGSWTKK